MMECFSCEDENCVIKTEKYSGQYPCMVCEHIRTPQLNEYCITCISTQKACCFKERSADSEEQP